MESTQPADVRASAPSPERDSVLTPEYTKESSAESHGSQRPAPPPSGRRRSAVWTAVGITAAALTVGIVPRLRQADKLRALTLAADSDVVSVNVARPHRAPSDTEVDLPANVQAIEETTISARTTGYVSQRFVDIGSRVRAGQALAVIQAPDLDQQLVQARAESARSSASREQAQADVAREKANVIQASAELMRSRSNLEAVRADLAHANAKLVEAHGAAAEARANLTQSEHKLSGARAALTRARARLAMAEKTYRRWQELARGGAVSGEELDETETAYLSSQSDVDAAKASVDSASAEVDAARQAVLSRDADVTAAVADTNAARQKVGASEADVASSQANVNSMRYNVEAGKANVRAQRANVRASEANVGRFGALQGYERVTAPFSGVITARNVDVGDLVNAGSIGGGASDPTATVTQTGLFGLARTDVLRLQVKVPQAYAEGIHPGDTASVSVQEMPGRSFRGVVFDTSGALDATSRTRLVEVRVPNPAGALVPGTYAQVHFITTRRAPLLRIPATALIFDAQGTRVATVTRDLRIHFQPVSVGRDFGNEVEITAGLTGDEELVSNPTDLLREQTPVRIVDDAGQGSNG